MAKALPTRISWSLILSTTVWTHASRIHTSAFLRPHLYRHSRPPVFARAYSTFVPKNVIISYCTTADAHSATESDNELLPMGLTPDFGVVKQYTVPPDGLNLDSRIDQKAIQRLTLTSKNMTLPVALCCLDPETYPTLSRSRKACRTGGILIQRNSPEEQKWVQGYPHNRVFPLDSIAKQVRLSGLYYPPNDTSYNVPVVYEDDHFAIVNKPAGMIVFSNRHDGHGQHALKEALPFVLTKPKPNTLDVLRRPQPVHKLDKATCGLLIVAKTQPALLNLSNQFRERKVKKSYTALVNGIPRINDVISLEEARALNVDATSDVPSVAPQSSDADADSTESSSTWNLIDDPLAGQTSVTVWRTIKSCRSINAQDGYLTLVDLKPKTGRFHQLRRHMAWVCECPIVGDNHYDGGLLKGDALALRRNGLLLCSYKVTLEHPYYNTPAGREEFDHTLTEKDGQSPFIWDYTDDKPTLLVSAEIEIPEKFQTMMDEEELYYATK